MHFASNEMQRFVLIFGAFHICDAGGWLELAKKPLGKSDVVTVEDLMSGTTVDLTNCGNVADVIQVKQLTFDREKLTAKVVGVAGRDVVDGTVVAKTSVSALQSTASVKSKFLQKLGYILGGHR